MGHTDYSADADTSIHLAAVNLDPFDTRSMDMEIVAGDGTIITHVDQGWLQETFNVNLTLRLLAVNYDVSFVSDILYFDLSQRAPDRPGDLRPHQLQHQHLLSAIAVTWSC